MRHAREDYNHIQDITAARHLAELVLAMEMPTPAGARAQQLAREVLGQSAPKHARIPEDEPVFLIRAKDVVSGDAVRAWADLAQAAGAAPDILELARRHAALMDAWPCKKTADVAPSSPLAA